MNGANLAKIQHLKVRKEWCEGDELVGLDSRISLTFL